MTRFIKVHAQEGGEAVLLNVAHIVSVAARYDNHGTVLHLSIPHSEKRPRGQEFRESLSWFEGILGTRGVNR